MSSSKSFQRYISRQKDWGNKEKKKSTNRYQSPKSVRKSINRLMDLIRCNATDSARCKWITVTYAEVMTDGKQAFRVIEVDKVTNNI